MDDENEMRLVCGLAGDPITIMSPGTTRGHHCTICADEIVMSPRMRDFWEAHPKAQPVCARCAAGLDIDKVAAIPGSVPAGPIGTAIAEAIHEGIKKQYEGEKRGHFN